MKVLITHELFAPDIAGGGEKVALEMARGLKSKGIDIKVLTTGNPKIKEFEGIETIRLPINRYLMNFTWPWIRKYTKDVDLIQTMNYNACFPSWMAAKSLKKPVVCLVTGMYGKKWLKIRGCLAGSLSMLAERFQINHDYSKIIFLSEFSRKCGIDIGIQRNLTEVINPGIEHKKFKPMKKEWFVLFMGRFAKQKGIYDLVEAAKQLPNTNFKLVGWGKEEKKLRMLATENVEFLNLTFRSGKPFYDLYSRAAIFCLPSLAETFGLVIVEAMASGCAIVSTVPLDYEGVTVRANATKQLRNAIEYLIDNPKKTLKMGRENVKKAKKYTWKNFTNELLKVYDEVI